MIFPYPAFAVTQEATVVYANELAKFLPEKSEKQLVSLSLNMPELSNPLTWHTCLKYVEHAAFAVVLGAVNTSPSIGSSATTSIFWETSTLARTYAPSPTSKAWPE